MSTRELRRWTRSTSGLEYREILTLERVTLPASPGKIPVGIESGCRVTVQVMADGTETVVAIRPDKRRR